MTEHDATRGVEPLTRGGVEEVRRHPASRCELALVATIDAERAECERLRAAMREAFAHTHCAEVQSIPSDDQILTDHMRSSSEILRAALAARR